MKATKRVTGRHHEHLAGEEMPTASDRSVGLVLATACVVLTFAPLVRGHSPRLWLLALAVPLAVLALARPQWLRPVNRAWMAFGAVANTIVTSILMALVFFGVVTPLAWLRRRLGHDPLSLRPDPFASTYWRERRPPGPAPETMKNQF
jgi:saxitoxin biosynthesis operon SxtJ-like protein